MFACARHVYMCIFTRVGIDEDGTGNVKAVRKLYLLCN